jgi:Trypsin
MFDTLRLLSTTTILLVGTLTPLQPAASGVVGVFGATHHDSEPVRDALLARPHRIDDAVADVIVRLHGPVCTGTPITGTVYVVTAAHCVLTKSGEVTQRTVVRDGHRYPAVAVLVDTAYADHPRESVDAAVLVMAQVIPGPSARVGSAFPTSGEVALAGYQPVDSDGSLLRGDRPSDHPLPKDATGTQIKIPFRPAGCVESVDTLEVLAARVMVHCGLVPGASGGGLFTEVNGELVLVGILSTVTADLSANFIVPLASLQKLLEHPDRYAHGFSTGDTGRDHSRSPDVYGHGEH